MIDSPMFSIVVTDYEPSVSRDDFRRKMQCLAAQTCKDFEVLVYHDGPKSTPYTKDVAGLDLHENTRFTVTEARANDWGHSNRDRGIREAQGTWIIHTNADNVFYPMLVKRLKEAIEDPSPTMRETTRYGRRIRIVLLCFDYFFKTAHSKRTFTECSDKEVMVYGILKRGLVATRNSFYRFPNLAHQRALIFGGVPVRFGNIDAMQFVMRRDLWLQVGGWYDRREESDGYMYERLSKRFVVTAVPDILGEHW